MDVKDAEKSPELIWIQLKRDMDALHKVETSKERFLRKIGENPVVPIGCLATASALVLGLWSFKEGKSQLSQYMMRTRVFAQVFTVVSLIAGLGFSAARL